MTNRKKMIDTIFVAYHGAVGFLIGLLLLVLGNSVWVHMVLVQSILNAIGSTFVVGSVFGMLYTRILQNIHNDHLEYLLHREKSGFRKLYPRSDDPELLSEIENSLRSAKDVKLFGMAINFLWHTNLFKLLVERAKAKRSKVSILLGNVESTQIQQRLVEEEGCSFPNTNGKDVISNLVSKLQAIEAEINDFQFFGVRLFEHYPTFALVIIDEDIFCYPYGYKTVGTICPAIHLRGFNSIQVQFYRDQFDLLEKEYAKTMKL